VKIVYSIAAWLLDKHILNHKHQELFAEILNQFSKIQKFKRQRLTFGQPQTYAPISKFIERARGVKVLAVATEFGLHECIKLEHECGVAGLRIGFVTYYDTLTKSRFEGRGLRVVDLKDAWVDTAQDILIHERIEASWKLLSNELVGKGLAKDIVELVRIDFFDSALAQSRMMEAAERLLHEGCDICVVVVKRGQQTSLATFLMMSMVNSSTESFQLDSNASGLWVRELSIQYNADLFHATLGVHNQSQPVNIDSNIRIPLLSTQSLMSSGDGHACAISNQGMLFVLTAMPGSIYWDSLCKLIRTLRIRFPSIRIISNIYYTKSEKEETGGPIDTLSIKSSLLSNSDELLNITAKQLRLKIWEILLSPNMTGSSLQSPAIMGALSWLASSISEHSILTKISRQQEITLLARHGNVGAILVFPHFNDFAHTALIAAQREGIPSISGPLVTITSNAASLVGWDMVDYVTCYGDQCAEAFHTVYGNYPTCKMVGNLYADIILGFKSDQARDEVILATNLPSVRTILLVATSKIDPDEIIWIKMVAKWCSQLGDVGLIVKVHPSFSKDIYASVEEAGEGYARVLDDRVSLYKLLAAANCCITDFSTVGSYAVVSNKTLIVANMKGFKFPANNYVEYGVAWPARSIDELLDTLLKYVNGALSSVPSQVGRQRFISDYFFMNDGRTASRYADAIMEIMGHEATPTNIST
jgi:hypothetical protein